ncbi:hypothetical protein, partial [Klebsiella pneumoniae]|uniref:hypothetical protein n=1 Tax=Klebsiella pneumoniae TaxID=573 RepID=UPI00385302F0
FRMTADEKEFWEAVNDSIKPGQYDELRAGFLEGIREREELIQREINGTSRHGNRFLSEEAQRKSDYRIKWYSKELESF